MQAITTDQDLIARAIEHSPVVQLSADRKMLKKRIPSSNPHVFPTANSFPYASVPHNYFEESAAPLEMNPLSSPFPMQYYPICTGNTLIKL